MRSNLGMLMASLVGWELVAVSEDDQFFVAWNGSLTFRVFEITDADVQEVHVWTCGDIESIGREGQRVRDYSQRHLEAWIEGGAVKDT